MVFSHVGASGFVNAVVGEHWSRWVVRDFPHIFGVDVVWVADPVDKVVGTGDVREFRLDGCVRGVDKACGGVHVSDRSDTSVRSCEAHC